MKFDEHLPRKEKSVLGIPTIWLAASQLADLFGSGGVLSMYLKRVILK